MMPVKGANLYELLLLVIYVLGLFLSHPILAYSYSGDTHYKASLQRGAKLFMNYCSGCHSLNYLRYNRMAEDLGLMKFDGHIDENLLKNNLIFTKATIDAPIRIAMPPEDAKQWFGVVPPDLSLIARAKGAEWLYSYLNGFYRDDSRPFGANNHLVADVAMPNILETLNNELSENQFNTNLRDLVTFLVYVGEPERTLHHRLGLLVIGFLLIFFLVALSLKAVYWRKKGIK